MLLLCLFHTYQKYQWELKAPCACLIQHLRHVLYRQMRVFETRDHHPYDFTQTPGVAVALLGPHVEQAVQEIVVAFFEMIAIQCESLSSLIVAIILIALQATRIALPICLVYVIVVAVLLCMLFSMQDR